MITDIRLKNFRSYTDDSFEFSPGVNIIVGPNASGKTNLLEAILLIAIGKSYRTTDTHEMIKQGSKAARLEIQTSDNNTRIVLLTKNKQGAEKEFKINGQLAKRLSFPKQLPIVLFEPNHVAAVTGAPNLRRQLLDDILEQIQPNYKSLSNQYKRTLAQRNNLLKRGSLLSTPQLFVWNVRLSELGEQIVQARYSIVSTINESLQPLYREITNTNVSLNVSYYSAIGFDNYATRLLKALEQNTDRDTMLGFTSQGPHRDDMILDLKGFSPQEAASRGEARSLMLVLEILKAQLIESKRGVVPILLLDDVFSELDGRRRQALTGFLKTRQTFITTTDADAVVHHFIQKTNVLPLVQG